MANQSIIHTKRQIHRARQTASAALAAQGNPWVSLQCVANDFLASAGLFEHADAEVRRLEATVKATVAASQDTLAPLAQAYEEVRTVANAKLGAGHPGKASFGTPDDLVIAAQELREQLALCEAGGWTEPLCRVLNEAATRAVEARAEATALRKELQKAQQEREAAACAMRPVFVCFRRLVRCVFGRSSREYRELLDRRARGAWIEDTDDPVAIIPPEAEAGASAEQASESAEQSVVVERPGDEVEQGTEPSFGVRELAEGSGAVEEPRASGEVEETAGSSFGEHDGAEASVVVEGPRAGDEVEAGAAGSVGTVRDR